MKVRARPSTAAVSVDVGRGAETHWEVTAWDLGTTERGSSGSCIFDQTTKGCVGWLTSGIASCAATDQPDFYGKLSVGWTDGGTDASRLSNWLDPVGGGTMTFLEGCDFNDHFWVFAAAATNVEYTVTVTETDSGKIRTYGNELGVASPAIVDTSAFAACP